MAFYTAEQVANMFQLGTVDELFDEELLRGVAKKRGDLPVATILHVDTAENVDTLPDEVDVVECVTNAVTPEAIVDAIGIEVENEETENPMITDISFRRKRCNE